KTEHYQNIKSKQKTISMLIEYFKYMFFYNKKMNGYRTSQQ
ncbi:hypothetical protein ECPA10_0241, partial [Escherichia coli PA10]